MRRTQAILFFVFLLGGPALSAAPKLRLSTTTVGPISVAQGANPQGRAIEAFNFGDGSLNLQYSSSAAWVSASTGGARPCTDRPATCLPVNFAFNTASLAAGVQTAVVTISDPNALDAPQTVTVTVQVGGGVPNRVSLFVPPNGTLAESSFSTNSILSGSATTQSGGPWLSLTLDGTGSFRFVLPYRIRARRLEGMPEGTYSGQIVTTGSAVAGENKTVPVTFQVTSQPIAQAAPEQVVFRAAQGSADQKAGLSLNNSGLGTLTVSGVTATTETGGEWLAVERGEGNLITLTAKLGNLSPGTYTGAVSVSSNAANGAQNVAVRLEVLPQAPPLAFFEGVRNTGGFDVELAPGILASITGEQFTFQESQSVTSLPLQTEVNGVRVLINDLPAPISFLSANQINFQVPFEVTPGEAVVRVERQGIQGNRVTALVAAQAPRILRSGSGEAGMISNADGSQATPGGTPATPGQPITILCIGLGATDVIVPAGSAAPTEEPFARVNPGPRVIFGSPFTGTLAADPIFAGLAPGLVGIYQVVVAVPMETPRGDILVLLEGDNYQSNRVIMPVREPVQE